MQKIKTIFIGTSNFAVPSLNVLAKNNLLDITAVITKLDKKTGRRQLLTQSPVKITALKNNLKVYQPEKIKEFSQEIKKLEPDLIIVISYGQILPVEIINAPRYGSVNVHGSLLPRYRGASCIAAAILNGDEETGISIIKMDEGVDSGPIIFQKSAVVLGNDTAATLHDRLSLLAAEVIVPVLKDYVGGKITPIAQNEHNACYAKTLKKSDGKINWKSSAREVERFIRAMNPWPVAFSLWRDKTLKIIEVKQMVLNINNHKIGEIFRHNSETAVRCGKDSLVILKVQLEGKKVLSVEDFLRGHADFIGGCLT